MLFTYFAFTPKLILVCQKLSMNKDFSFIRFLKVVKTLYESSVFTQLGKTVGSALGPSSPLDKDMITRRDRDKSTADYYANMSDERAETLFDVLAHACSSVRFHKKSSRKRRTDNSIEEDEQETRDKASPDAGSIIEKVLNCTMMERDEDFSDEDSFKSNSYDIGSNSFDSLTDEEEPHRSHRQRR